MNQKRIAIIILSVFLIFSVFSKDKLSESSTSLIYSYAEWSEFYTDLIQAAKTDTYKYAFLKNEFNKDEISNTLKSENDNSWKLLSYKGLQGRDMIYAFYIVSPNMHKTVVIFSNNSIEASKYEIANKNTLKSYSWSAFDEEPVTVKSASVSKVTSTTKTSSSNTPKKADSTKDSDSDKLFIERIIPLFDEQLAFFDEDIPLKLSKFYKK